MLSLVRGASDKPIVDSATGDTTASFFGPFFRPGRSCVQDAIFFAPSHKRNTVCRRLVEVASLV
jgi:hypothetical protein